MLPMLAVSNTGAGNRQPVDLRRLIESGDWIADLKLDGVRALLTPEGRILNRKGADVTHKFPEITNDTGHLLDGEIVAVDGSFETTLMRESQEKAPAIGRLAESHPVAFVGFDAPEIPGAWTERRARLADLLPVLTPVSTKTGFFDDVRSSGGEGVIVKRIASKYQPGKRSGDWIKWKAVRRISCIAYGYTPGHGSRAHFGALHLALIKDGEVVPVGKTGSGFTDAQTHDLKARLDRGEWFVAEVEFLNYTGNALRFPVMRGVRSDLSVTDCTFDQISN